MPPSGDACVQTCPSCNSLIDVREQEPLAKFDCPVCGAPMQADRRYNHFTVVEHLGTGGMGAVYKALDRNLNRMVALKLLRKELSEDEAYIAKLEEEARITASINHPFVVKVFSFGHDSGQYYIAMELVDKGSLDDLMQIQHRVAELQGLQVGLQIASGLQAAHERGLIHRDVKPGNILFADAHTAKITDFGLALLAEQEAESRGEIWGTPYYIAPEKLNSEPEDFRSDIYSLGGTLFHAIAGRPPFEAESASLVALKHLKSRAVSLQAFAPDVSSETAYVINRMLNKDPNQRYGSYTELIEHFRYAIDTINANAGKPRAGRARVVVESERQSSLIGILMLVLLVLMVAGAGAAYVFRDRLFPKDPASTGEKVATSAGAATADAKPSSNALYDEARHKIVDEKYAEARESFNALAKQTPLPIRPQLDWIQVHQGLTALLNHQAADARKIFTDLRKSDLFSREDKDLPLANFFIEAGRLLSDNKAVPASVAKNWNSNSVEAMALLLFGVKDWEMGDFQNADGLFKAYLGGKPASPYGWISDYVPIARKAVHDFALYAPLQERLKANNGDRAALLADFTKARDQLQTTGKMVEAFLAATTALGRDPSPPGAVAAGGSSTIAASPGASPAPVTSVAPPTPSLTAAKDHEAETVRWQTARESYEQMIAVYRYDEAQAVIDRIKLNDPDFVRARNLIATRVRLLVAFKKTLINDLNHSGGYPQPVSDRHNTAYPRGLKGASADTLQGGTPYGTITLPWTDFAPVVFVAVAAYYADASTNPQQAADRRWLAATFALENGRGAEARALAARAAQDQPAYKKDLAQFNAPAGVPPH